MRSKAQQFQAAGMFAGGLLFASTGGVSRDSFALAFYIARIAEMLRTSRL